LNNIIPSAAGLPELEAASGNGVSEPPRKIMYSPISARNTTPSRIARVRCPLIFSPPGSFSPPSSMMTNRNRIMMAPA